MCEMGNRNWGEDIRAMWPPLDKGCSCLRIIQSPALTKLAGANDGVLSLASGLEPIWPVTEFFL